MLDWAGHNTSWEVVDLGTSCMGDVAHPSLPVGEEDSTWAGHNREASLVELGVGHSHNMEGQSGVVLVAGVEERGA